MRDLDRIREVREFRVTGPQLTSFLVSAVVLAAAVFAVGYQLGRLQAPVDVALLEPLGGDERDAGSLLAEMLAEDEAPALASTAPSSPLTTSDSTRSRPEPIEARTEVLPVEEPELPGEPEPMDAEPIALPLPSEEIAAIERPTQRPPLVVEVVERSFPEEEPEATPEPAPEPTPEPAPELPTTAPEPASVASLPGPPAGRGFTVQVGAFESLTEAEETLRSLQAQGHGDAFHVAADVNGTTWHRVRVGLYPSRSDADAAARRLANATPHGTFVTSQP